MLELACGTGKDLVPASAALLDRNISAPKLVLGDMRHFAFNKKFRSVLIAGNSLCHLLTTGELDGLRCVRNHLIPVGGS